jgi:hypothetical protein
MMLSLRCQTEWLLTITHLSQDEPTRDLSGCLGPTYLLRVGAPQPPDAPSVICEHPAECRPKVLVQLDHLLMDGTEPGIGGEGRRRGNTRLGT